MDRARDTINWQSWVADSAVGKSAQYRRRHVLELWAKANGKASPTEALDQIFLDKVTPYDTVRRFLDQLREKEFKPGTVQPAVSNEELRGSPQAPSCQL